MKNFHKRGGGGLLVFILLFRNLKAQNGIFWAYFGPYVIKVGVTGKQPFKWNGINEKKFTLKNGRKNLNKDFTTTGRGVTIL